jgi:hypothetical protein
MVLILDFGKNFLGLGDDSEVHCML